MKRDDWPKTNAKLKDEVLKAATGNHVWIDAFTLINPTDETLLNLGRLVARMVTDRASLLPSFYGSAEGDVSDIQRLSPTLYLSINAS